MKHHTPVVKHGTLLLIIESSVYAMWVYVVSSEDCFDINMLFHQNRDRDSHCNDKMISLPSYLYAGNMHTWNDNLYIETAPYRSSHAIYLSRDIMNRHWPSCPLEAVYCKYSVDVWSYGLANRFIVDSLLFHLVNRCKIPLRHNVTELHNDNHGRIQGVTLACKNKTFKGTLMVCISISASCKNCGGFLWVSFIDRS